MPLTKIDTGAIKDNAINSAKIADGTVVASDVLDNTITGAKLASDIAISTSGNITTTGALTSTGIDDNATSTAITIDSSNRVGIGTSSPTKPLHVNSGSTNNVVFFESTDNNANIALQDNNGGAVLGTGDTGQLKFYTGYDATFSGGSEVMRIDSSGNVGIGTSSPTEKLEVYGTEASDGIEILLHNVGNDGVDTVPYTAIRSKLSLIRNGGEIRFGRDDTYGSAGSADSNLQFYTALNDVNTERMRINSSGKVGIGTSSPLQLLHLEASNVTMRLEDTDASGYSLISTTGTSDLQFKADDGNNDADSKITFDVDGSERMRITSGGNLIIGDTTEAAARTGKLKVRNDVDYSTTEFEDDATILVQNETNNNSASIVFHSNNASGSSFRSAIIGGYINDTANALGFYGDVASLTTSTDPDVIITASGKVGIGTTSPTENLEVTDTAANIPKIRIQTSDGGNKRLDLYVESSHGYVTARQSAQNLNFNATANLIFLNGASGGTEKMRIDSSGNVGIGTTSPSSTLHISGDPQVQLTQPNNLVLQNDTDSATSGDAKTGILFRANYNGTTPTDLANITAGKENATNNNFASFIGLCTRTNGVNTLVERMRVTPSAVFINATSEPSQGDNGVRISATDVYHVFCRNSTASVFRTFGSSGEFRTIGNGNAQNTNNSYGAISDRELKENEVDANSQWNDIKALQIKNYNLKSQPNQTHLGVIAQDLEASGMNGVVEQNEDEIYTEEDVLPEGKNIGDVKEKGYKTVKYSILYMKAVKALQEAMERIETLEAKNTELEARITALETQP